MQIEIQDTYQCNSDHAEIAKKDSVPCGQRRAADAFDGAVSPVSMMMKCRLKIGSRHVIVRRFVSGPEKIASQWMEVIFRTFLHCEIDARLNLPTGASL